MSAFVYSVYILTFVLTCQYTSWIKGSYTLQVDYLNTFLQTASTCPVHPYFFFLKNNNISLLVSLLTVQLAKLHSFNDQAITIVKPPLLSVYLSR